MEHIPGHVRVRGIRGADSEARSTVPVPIRGGIDGEDDGLGTGLLGALEDELGGGVVGVEVDLLERDLGAVRWLGGGNGLDGERGV